MEQKKNIWYASWFNTPYYHILYKDRSFKEANAFVKKITTHLQLPKGASVLDLACGKGRHSKNLYQLGFQVTGADLSSESIQYAKQFETERLKFIEHDMRKPLPDTYDVVLNLFTSFGYFDNEEDNLITLKAIRNNLNTNGYGVIDFLNVDYVKNHIVPSETKVIDNIQFNITRKITKNHIIKEIAFYDNEKPYSFTEKVSTLNLSDFKKMFELSNIKLVQTFGSYDLETFNPLTSERLILIFRP